MLFMNQSLLHYQIALYVKSCTSTRATLSALNHKGRISQRGDTAPAEELRCAIPQVKDLVLGRNCVSHRARRCGKVGDIADPRKCALQGRIVWRYTDHLADRRAAREEVARRTEERPQLGELRASVGLPQNPVQDT